MSRNRQILRLALPSIISNITVPLLGLVDVAITGHMGSAVYIGAISVGSMVFKSRFGSVTGGQHHLGTVVDHAQLIWVTVWSRGVPEPLYT